MPRLMHLATAAALVAVAACSEPTAPSGAPVATPVATISDAAHAGGPSHFFFLPPVVKAPGALTGTFDAALLPRVEVCELSGSACAGTVATFLSGGSGPDAVKLDAAAQSYKVNFQTSRYSLDPSRTYRISVFVGAVRLGYADLKVVKSGGDQKGIDPEQYAVVKNGSTLSIAFRIENGIAGAVAVSPALDSIPVGQTAQFTAAVTDLHGAPLSGAPLAWSSSDPAVAMVDVNGLASGVAIGTATITATSGGASGSATLVVTNPNHPPLAVDDTFDAIGNVTVPVTAPGVLAGDTDPDAGNALTAVAGTFPTAAGGTITVAADGSFSYLSAPGFTGTDSAPYVVTDGIAADTGQVVLNVAQRVWYVRNTAAAPGDGRDASPFATLSQAEAASVAGETILVLFGDVGITGMNAGISLKSGQSLIGQGISTPVVAAVNGSPLVLLAAGSAPTIGRSSAGTTVQLATNNTVRGVGIASSAGDAVAGSNFGTLTMAEVAVGATGGAGVTLQDGTAAVTLSNLSSSGSADAGLKLVNVAGSFSAASGSISDASSAGVFLSGGDANVGYGGSVTAASGRSVWVESRTGGSVDLSGDITDNAAGLLVHGVSGGTVAFTGASKVLSTGANTAVNVASNTGATVVFAGGGLNVSTTTGVAFTATGGGTVIVTGAHNRLAAHGARALSVANTIIGSSGLTFESISADGGVNGIFLSATGSTNGLQVTGTGAAGTGGTIRGMTGDGVSLASVKNVRLAWMQIQNNLGSGIFGSSVTDVRVENSTVSNNADNAVAHEAGIRFDNLFGTSAIDNTTVFGSIEDNVRVVNSSGTLTLLSVTGSTIRDNTVASPGRYGLLLSSEGAATMNVVVQNSHFLRNRIAGVEANTQGGGVLAIDLTGGSLQSNGIGAEIVHNSTGALTYDVLNIGTITGQGLIPINVSRLNTAGAASTFSGTISGNVIGTLGVTNSGAAAGPGIRVQSGGAGGTLTTAITNNTIREVTGRGVDLLVRDGSSTLNATVTGNLIALTSPVSLEGIRFDSGALTTDQTKGCAAISGNTITTFAGFNAIRLRQRFLNTTFQLAAYGGSPTNDAAVVAFLLSTNTAANAAADHGGAGFIGVAACPTP
jgi:hypothetical protein